MIWLIPLWTGDYKFVYAFLLYAFRIIDDAYLKLALLNFIFNFGNLNQHIRFCSRIIAGMV